MTEIIIFGASVGCWWLVLNKKSRDPRLAQAFFRLSDDEQKMLEALWFAVMLIGALFFTILFIFLLVRRTVEWM